MPCNEHGILQCDFLKIGVDCRLSGTLNRQLVKDTNSMLLCLEFWHRNLLPPGRSAALTFTHNCNLSHWAWTKHPGIESMLSYLHWHLCSSRRPLLIAEVSILAKLKCSLFAAESHSATGTLEVFLSPFLRLFSGEVAVTLHEVGFPQLLGLFRGSCVVIIVYSIRKFFSRRGPWFTSGERWRDFSLLSSADRPHSFARDFSGVPS